MHLSLEGEYINWRFPVFCLTTTLNLLPPLILKIREFFFQEALTSQGPFLTLRSKFNLYLTQPKISTHKKQKKNILFLIFIKNKARIYCVVAKQNTRIRR